MAWVGVVVELFDDGLQMGGFSIGEIGVVLAILFDEREVFFDQPGLSLVAKLVCSTSSPLLLHKSTCLKLAV